MDEIILLDEEELLEVEGGSTGRFWAYVSYEIVNGVKKLINS